MVLEGWLPTGQSWTGEEAAETGPEVVFWKAWLLEIQTLWLEMETLMCLLFLGSPRAKPHGSRWDPKELQRESASSFLLHPAGVFSSESFPSSQNCYSNRPRDHSATLPGTQETKGLLY